MPEERASFYLQVVDPAGTVSVLPLRGRATTIGRALDSDVPLRSGAASRRHALLEITPSGSVTITDLGSKNGVALEGRRIPPNQPVPVSFLDSVEICGFRMRVLPDASAGAITAGTVRPRTSVVEVLEARELRGQLMGLQSTHQLAEGVDLRLPRDELLGAAVEIMRTRDLDLVHQQLLDLVQQVVGYDAAYLLSWDPDEARPRVEAIRCQAGLTSPPQVSHSIISDVVASGQPVLVHDALTDARYGGAQSVVSMGHSTAIAAPLQAPDGTVLRIIYLLRLEQAGAYEPSDVQALAYVAALAAMRFHGDVGAIEELRQQNALLKEEALQNRFLAGELSVGARIQQELLPDEMPRVVGYDLASFYVPCRIMGGDFYDCLELEDGRLCFYLGDVSGKGAGAAMLMFGVVTVFRTLVLGLEQRPEFPGIMGRANRSLRHTLTEGRFTTAWAGLLDPTSGRIIYSSSGHPALLVRRSGEVEPLATHGPPLGLFPDSTYREDEVRLEPGDLLCLYSDGVPETRDPEGSCLGAPRLASELVALRTRSSQEIALAIQETLDTFGGDAPPPDDRACMIVRRLDSSGGPA